MWYRQFGAPASADDVIVAMVQETKDPGRIRVVSGDKAIGSEARHHRCRHTTSVAFVKGKECCYKDGEE